MKIIWCMIPGTWSARDRIFLPSWAIFCPFIPMTAWKMKISKNNKNRLEISSFYTSVPKVMIICYTVPEIWCVTDVIIVHFGLFFALLPPSSLKNQNKRGNWKNDSSTLHLEVWTRYFRPRYSIKVSGTSVNLKIIKPHQCSPERSHL